MDLKWYIDHWILRHVASVLVDPTRFQLVIANIISQDDSFIRSSSSSPSSSYVDVGKYFKYLFEIKQESFNILDGGKKNQ